MTSETCASSLHSGTLHDHLCLIYESFVEQCAAFVPFIRIGLERGEKCLYVADDNEAEAVLSAMRSYGIDVDAALASGALAVCGPQQSYLEQGYFDPERMMECLKHHIREAQRQGCSGLRIAGEMSWALGGDAGTDRLIEYENSLNRFLPEHNCCALCQYNARRFSPDTIRDVICTHPFILFGTAMCENFYFIPPDGFDMRNNAQSQVDFFLTNIKERKQTSDQLRYSEERQKNLIDTAAEAIILQDASGEILVWNSGAEKLFGISADEVVGRDSIDYDWHVVNEDGSPLHPKDHPSMITLQTGKPFTDFVAGIKRHAGDITWVSVNTRPIFAVDDKKPAQAVITIRDITGRTRAEQQLRKSEAQFRAIADNTSASIFLTDEKGIIIYWNQASEKIFGYTEEEICGEPIDILLLDEEIQAKNSAFARYDDIRESPVFGSPHRSYARRKDGTVFPLEVILSSWEHEGKSYFCSILNDISELRNAEEQLKAIFNSSSDAIIITDSAGTILSCNPATESVFGFVPGELIGRPVKTMVPEGMHSDIDEHLRNNTLLRAGKTYVSVLPRKDGSEVYVSSSMARWEIAGRTFYSSISRDVTRDRKIDKQLRHSQKMESIGTLAGGIAHEFNNIIGGMMGYAEVAKDLVTADSAAQNLLDDILGLGTRASAIVRQMLVYGRTDTVQKAPLQIHLSLKEQMKFLRSIIPANIEIHTHIDEHAGTVIADAAQMQQIGMNLCTNAVHAMEANGGRLEIALSAVSLDEESARSFQHVAPGRYVRLTVSDTGPGIAPEISDRIFDPFFTTKPTGKGTGLGLSVVDGIVREHGGAIAVESTPGRGASFTVLLPAVEAREAAPPEPAKNSIPGGTERILLVDDEESIAVTMNIMLSRLGYAVTVRSSSSEALETFKENPHGFDLVITDLTMPEMTGDELAAEALAVRPDIPVILMTGYNDLIGSDRIKMQGITDVMPKPCKKAEVAQTVRRVLDEHGSR